MKADPAADVSSCRSLIEPICRGTCGAAMALSGIRRGRRSNSRPIDECRHAPGRSRTSSSPSRVGQRPSHAAPPYRLATGVSRAGATCGDAGVLRQDLENTSTARYQIDCTSAQERPMARQHRIASIPADGIGPEVISAGLEVLDAVAARDGGFSLIVDHYDWGSDRYRKHGSSCRPMRSPGCAPRTRSISARSATRTSPTTSRCGACGCRSARASTSTPTFARRASCPASPRRCATSGRATSTG